MALMRGSMHGIASAALLWAARAAGADAFEGPLMAGGQPVRVEMPGCETPPFDAEALLALLRLELGQEEPPAGATATLREAPVRVELRASSCNGDDAEVVVVVTRAEAPVSMTLGALPEAARPRALALVIAETLRRRALASVESRSQPASVLSEPSPLVAEPSRWALQSSADAELGELYHRSDPYPLDERLRLRGGVHAHYLTADPNLLLGVEGGISVPLQREIEWTLDVSYAYGNTYPELASVDWWSGAVGLDFVFFRRAFRASPRFALGRIARWEGRGTGTDHLVPMLGARATLRVPPSAPVGLEIVLDAAHALTFASLNGAATPHDLQGFIVSWGIGASFAP